MSHEIICEALAECLADNKQSINDRNYYRAKVVNVTFLRKQPFITERQAVSWHLL